MDDFAAKEKKEVKEKNLYILHLDTPRILIISSVMIGLIIISVLIGMNINGDNKKNNDSFSQEDAILNSLISENKTQNDAPGNNSFDPSNEKGILPENPGSDSSAMPDDSLGNNTHGNNLSKSPLLSDNNIQKSVIPNNDPSSTSDILTHENIESIIPPVRELKKVSSENGKHNKKNKKNTQKKRIVEVAQKEAFSAPETNQSYYSVQVASFDKKTKAVAEIKNLEDLKYNAFLDRSRVNGKTFYQVRVGPVYSQKKACNLLDELSADERYQDSYIVKK